MIKEDHYALDKEELQIFINYSVFNSTNLFDIFLITINQCSKKKAKATTESMEKETDEFEPYENGGKLDSKLSDSNGKEIKAAPQE